MKKLRITLIVASILLLLLLPSLFAETQPGPEELLLVNVEIPPDYQKVQTDETILVETEILLLDRFRTEAITDVLIEYKIKDQEGKVITELSETKGGLVRIETIKELHPTLLPPGTYIVMVKASYKEVTGEAYTSFEVVDKVVSLPDEPHLTLDLLIILLLVMISFFLFLLYQFWKIKKLRKR